MSILLRKKLEASYEDFFNHEYKYYGGIRENVQQAINLRRLFVQEYILNRQPHEYKTPVERDWAYVCRREYVYDCNIMPLADAAFYGIIAMCAR